jgi:ABC-2 type transport system permease protein
LAFFSMLTFSNLIIMLTTSYISREVEFYMAQPIAHRRLFFCKFAESTIYSSWAFLVLSLPFFLALGGMEEADPYFRWGTILPDAPWSFYPLTAFLLAPYIVIPAALGAIIALLITAFFPARRMFRLALALAVVTVVLGVFIGNQSNTGLRFRKGEPGEIGRVMGFMGIGDISWAPSTWLARGIRGAMSSDWSEVLFWAALLYASALMVLQVCYWLAGPLYYAGFCGARSSGTSFRKREGGLFAFFHKLARPLPLAVRSLVVKDLTVFWRDPAQWGQLMVLFGLLFIYVANLGSASEISRIRSQVPAFQSLTTLFNIGATCFVLAIITTRFIYPMLSLEGKQQWVIGLAPLPRTRLVWVKYFLSWACSLLLCLPLVLLSCYVLETDRYITALSIATILCMSLGLTSLAIGLGALMPNFQEDNPARIANGLGGTINVIVSLIYIAATLALETPLVGYYIAQAPPPTAIGKIIFIASVPLLVFLQLIIIAGPMTLGLRKWKALEF